MNSLRPRPSRGERVTTSRAEFLPRVWSYPDILRAIAQWESPALDVPRPDWLTSLLASKAGTLRD